MYVDKSALGLRLMRPNKILAMQNAKLHVENVRAKTNVSEMINAVQQMVQIYSGRSRHIIELPQNEKIWVQTWVDNVAEQTNRRIMTLPQIVQNEKVQWSKTTIDFAFEYVKENTNAEKLCKKINHVRMCKQVWLPFELVGLNGRGRTGCFTLEDEKIPINWWFVKKDVEKLNKNCFKEWCDFLEWLVNQKFEKRCNVNIETQ